MFFVGTAPLDGCGHVNLSPKGLDGTFAVLGPTTVAYLDLTGSGVETIAHVRENGRIVLMFCTFEGAPRIVRIHGQGTVLEPHHPDFDGLRERFGEYPARSIIRIETTRISDSCGFGVPRYEHVGPRSQLLEWAEKRGPGGLRRYQRERNARSLDGLPGLEGPVSSD